MAKKRKNRRTSSRTREGRGAPKVAARLAVAGAASAKQVSSATDTIDFALEWDGGHGELIALYDGDALQVAKVAGSGTIEGTYTTPVKERHNVGWALVLAEPATNLRFYMGKNGAELQLLKSAEKADALWHDDASLE